MKHKKTATHPFLLTLKSVGNPDHHEYYGEGVKSPTETHEVATIDEASALCRDYIELHDLGGGNWTGGEVTKDGRTIGRIHYNGRFTASA